MNSDREKYEELIKSSPLFEYEKDTAAYKREAYKMIEYLYLYLGANKEKSINEPYGMEIVEVATKCIEGFDSSKGEFLHYFNSSWSKTRKSLDSDESLQQNYGGMHFSDVKKRRYKKFKTLTGGQPLKADDIQIVADAMGITVEEVYDLEKIENNKALAEKEKNDGEDVYRILDHQDSGENIETEFQNIENAKAFLDKVEITFNNLQNRQKPLLSVLITSKLMLEVSEDSSLLDHFKSKAFFNDDIYQKMLQSGEQPQAKEIANLFGITEASLSRTWKTFKEKLG